MHGLPLEAFLFDPPVPYDARNLSRIGQELRQDDDQIYHVVDWIGETDYPEAVDFLEEVRAFGLSRRASPIFEFGKLGPLSRIYLVHARGFVTNRKRFACHFYPDERQHDRAGRCKVWTRKGSAEHLTDPAANCSRDLWSLVAATDHNGLGEPIRSSGDARYRIYPNPRHLGELDLKPGSGGLEWEPALVASFRLSGIGVVEERGNRHEATIEALNLMEPGLPVFSTKA